MALAEVCACAQNFRIALVLLGCALVGLCLPDVFAPVPERYYSRIRDGAEISAASPSTSFRTTDHVDSQINVSVRTVALKHVMGLGGEENPKLDSYESDGVVASWRATADQKFIGKARMVVRRRGRSLRTSKPYPCSLPPGTCQAAESCCKSSCANFAVNPNHCGRCGHICRPDRACCNGKCRRLATDERNCGQCGSRCALGTKCLFGLCGY